MRRNRGAAGVDSQSIRDIEQSGVESFLEALGDELRTGEYRPSLVRRRYKRLSGKLWERGPRLYFLQRWPSQRSMQRVRQRVKELTPGSRCHADIRDVIADVNPVLRGWGNYFRTGNAARRFNQLDTYVWRRLRDLRVERKGRNLRAGEAERWTPDYFHTLGLHQPSCDVQGRG